MLGFLSIDVEFYCIPQLIFKLFLLRDKKSFSIESFFNKLDVFNTNINSVEKFFF